MISLLSFVDGLDDGADETCGAEETDGALLEVMLDDGALLEVAPPDEVGALEPVLAVGFEDALGALAGLLEALGFEDTLLLDDVLFLDDVFLDEVLGAAELGPALSGSSRSAAVLSGVTSDTSSGLLSLSDTASEEIDASD